MPVELICLLPPKLSWFLIRCCHTPYIIEASHPRRWSWHRITTVQPWLWSTRWASAFWLTLITIDSGHISWWSPHHDCLTVVLLIVIIFAVIICFFKSTQLADDFQLHLWCHTFALHQALKHTTTLLWDQNHAYLPEPSFNMIFLQVGAFWDNWQHGKGCWSST